jgi:hypothetical protein
LKALENKNVNHPAHYFKNTGHEVIDVIHAWNLNYDLGNAVKYIARAGRKNPETLVEDLQKAVFYINYSIQLILEKERKENDEYKD